MLLEIDLNQLKHFNIAPHSIVDKDHRSVTQSLAISPGVTTWLYRRSDPGTVCCRHLNFDRFHRTCLQDVGIVVRSKQWGGKPKTDPTPHILAVGCHPRSTICHTAGECVRNVGKMWVPGANYSSSVMVAAAAATPHPDTNCARQIAG